MKREAVWDFLSQNLKDNLCMYDLLQQSAFH